jgi:flagellar hook-basal body complex protein FliE
VDLKKVVSGAYSITAPTTDPTIVVADTAPEATADQTPVDTAGQATPAQPDVDQPTASGTAAPATGPDIQTQLNQAMAEVNAAQAKYNQLVQQVAGGQTAIA